MNLVANAFGLHLPKAAHRRLGSGPREAGHQLLRAPAIASRLQWPFGDGAVRSPLPLVVLIGQVLDSLGRVQLHDFDNVTYRPAKTAFDAS